MNRKTLWVASLTVLIVFLGFAVSASPIEYRDKNAFTEDFFIELCTFSTTGINPFFILKPGFQYVLEGIEGKDEIRVVITVLDETKMIGNIETRVIEEYETKNGELAETSRNYYAICNETNSVFYFGEEVDMYENGAIVSHDGTWQAFSNGAEPGIYMPGTILLGSRYYQEIAPDVAMDRAENVGMNEVVKTPAGKFTRCLKTKETTPLEPNNIGIKFYALGFGLVKDGTLLLTGYSGL